MKKWLHVEAGALELSATANISGWLKTDQLLRAFTSRPKVASAWSALSSQAWP